MLFPTIFSIAVLAASASANLHRSCTCVVNGHYNAFVTSGACSIYANARYKWGTSVYNSDSGRCTAIGSGALGGNEWESACQGMAKDNGWPCENGQTCKAATGVRGSC